MAAVTVVVYGASDDLIEVEGGIDAEFNVYTPKGDVVFSDGTQLSYRYDDEGRWRFGAVVCGAGVTWDRVPCPTEADDPDEKNYSDRVTLTGPFAWVQCGDEREEARA